MRYLRRATWIYYYDRALTAAQSRTASATIALPRTASLSATTTGDAGRLDSSHHCVGLAMPFGNSATTAWTSGCSGPCQSTGRQAGPGNRLRLTKKRVPPGIGYHLGTWTAAWQSITTLCAMGTCCYLPRAKQYHSDYSMRGGARAELAQSLPQLTAAMVLPTPMVLPNSDSLVNWRSKLDTSLRCRYRK